MVNRITTEAPPDLRARGVPQALCLVLEQGLAKHPAERQHDAAQLGRQLQAAQAILGEPVTPLPIDSVGPRPAASSPSPSGPHRDTPTPRLPATEVSGARSPNNLPRARSSLIGREAALHELAKLVGDGEIVTVVGTGGIGKTRLAIEVARGLQGSYPDGVWLVELAPLPDVDLVVHAVATCLRVRDEPGHHMLDTLTRTIRDRRLLLVLDNCEHVVGDAAALCHALLSASETLAILATSREPLRVEGERVWRIPTLDVPARDDLPVEVLAETSAARLFCERAAAIGGFALGPSPRPRSPSSLGGSTVSRWPWSWRRPSPRPSSRRRSWLSSTVASNCSSAATAPHQPASRR